MWPISLMAWRIGEILDIDAQFDWIENAGLEAVSFHAWAGEGDRWRGVDPAAAGPERRRQLRERLAVFGRREVHAPFAAKVVQETMPGVLDQLAPVVDFCADVGVDVLTVHGDPPADGDDAWWEHALDRLDAMAAAAGLVVGLEFTFGFDRFLASRREHVGVTLDVGHLYHNDGAGYRPFGSVGTLIRRLGDAIVNLHVHDYNGADDHIEIGAGCIDYDDVLGALAAIGYDGALSMELNPIRCSPDGIRRSADRLRSVHQALGLS